MSRPALCFDKHHVSYRSIRCIISVITYNPLANQLHPLYQLTLFYGQSDTLIHPFNITIWIYQDYPLSSSISPIGSSGCNTWSTIHHNRAIPYHHVVSMCHVENVLPLRLSAYLISTKSFGIKPSLYLKPSKSSKHFLTNGPYKLLQPLTIHQHFLWFFLTKSTSGRAPHNDLARRASRLPGFPRPPAVFSTKEQ